jgi:hypothetical protein
VGLLDRLRPRRTDRDRFADDVIAELRRAGIRDAVYRRGRFAIVFDDGNPDGAERANCLFLANIYAECRRDPAGSRVRVRRFVATSLTQPPGFATFSSARPHLRPVLRGATYALGQPAGLRLLRRPALPYLDELVVVDQRQSMAYLDVSYSGRWRSSPEEIFAVARRSLGELPVLPPDLPPAEEPANVGTVLHLAETGDSFFVSRLLLDGWLAALTERVGGRPVAFVPAIWMLLVTADEPDLVKHMYELVEEQYRRSRRPLSPMAYTVDAAGRTVVYEPPPGHPAYHAAERARRLLMCDEYEHQRTALSGEPMAECMLVGRPDGTTCTAATWDTRTATLLPEVDYVGVSGATGDLYFVPWQVVVEADLLVEEIEHRPSRYRTPAAPSPAALGYLRERAVEP